MQKQTALTLILLTLTALFSALTQVANGANDQIEVPTNYPTIQEAINHANAGGTVFVKKGTYEECITIDKPLTLLGEGGAVIRGGWQQGGTVVLVTHDDVTVSGFAIQSAANGTHGNSVRGIHLLNVQGCTVANCTFSKDGTAIWLYGGQGNTIENNFIDGQEQYNGNCLVYTWTGISIQQSSNNTVRHNVLSGVSESGIELTDSHGNTIDENNLKGQWKNINLAASDNNTINNNNIIGGRFGIQQNTASYNQIENNTFTDAYTAIQANDGSCYNLFAKNNIIASKYCGIELHQNADHNKVLGNAIDRGANGIEIKNSANNTLTYNSITGTSLVGLIMVDASNNLIQKNNFVENTKHVSSSGPSNTWDANGKGNYWDTYNATDAGESQYVIDESNIDHFPLTEKANPTLLEAASPSPTDTAQPNMTAPQNILSILVAFGVLLGALVLITIGLYYKKRKNKST